MCPLCCEGTRGLKGHSKEFVHGGLNRTGAGSVSTVPVWWRIDKNTIAAVLGSPLRENQLVTSERKLGVNYHEGGVGAQGPGPSSRRDQGILTVQRGQCLHHFPHTDDVWNS